MLFHVTFARFWICLEKQRKLFQLDDFKSRGLGAWFVRIIEKPEGKLKSKSEKRRKKKLWAVISITITATYR